MTEFAVLCSYNVETMEKTMTSKVSRWGNSPAIRIPKPLLIAAGFSSTQNVTITATEGKLVVEPVQSPRFDLDELVSRITPENRHQEIDFGASVGREFN